MIQPFWRQYLRQFFVLLERLSPPFPVFVDISKVLCHQVVFVFIAIEKETEERKKFDILNLLSVAFPVLSLGVFLLTSRVIYNLETL